MWAGQLAVDAGGQLIGVAFDTAATGLELSRRLQPWLASTVDGDDLPAVFTVRGPRRVGRRTDLALLEYGCLVFARGHDLAHVTTALEHVVRDIDTPIERSTVRLPLRVFANDHDAALVAVESPTLVDDSRLRRSGVEELACWRAAVNVESATVQVASTELSLAGIVVDGDPSDLVLVRRQLWTMAEGDVEGWAVALHQVIDAGNLLIQRTDDCRGAIARLLS